MRRHLLQVVSIYHKVHRALDYREVSQKSAATIGDKCALLCAACCRTCLMPPVDLENGWLVSLVGVGKLRNELLAQARARKNSHIHSAAPPSVGSDCARVWRWPAAARGLQSGSEVSRLALQSRRAGPASRPGKLAWQASLASERVALSRTRVAGAHTSAQRRAQNCIANCTHGERTRQPAHTNTRNKSFFGDNNTQRRHTTPLQQVNRPNKPYVFQRAQHSTHTHTANISKTQTHLQPAVLLYPFVELKDEILTSTTN